MLIDEFCSSKHCAKDGSLLKTIKESAPSRAVCQSCLEKMSDQHDGDGGRFDIAIIRSALSNLFGPSFERWRRATVAADSWRQAIIQAQRWFLSTFKTSRGDDTATAKNADSCSDGSQTNVVDEIFENSEFMPIATFVLIFIIAM